MTEERHEAYEAALREIRAVTEGERDWVANLANIVAVLIERLPFSWLGFYRVVGEELVLGPFQGPPACVRIARGRGVCGVAWDRDETRVVADVHAFEGHIACDPRSRSEVVVPLHRSDGAVWGVLDVDSHRLDDFAPADVEGLEKIGGAVSEILARSDSGGPATP
jgi:GAF domain-containing protein